MTSAHFEAGEPVSLPAETVAVFTPLGIPIVVEASCPEDMTMIADVLGCWAGEIDPSARTLRLRVVRDGRGRDTGELQFRVHGPKLRIDGGGLEGCADATSGEACCRLSNQPFRDRERWLDEAFKTLLLFLLCAGGRTPVHASAFLAGDTAILLAGVSGSGKSCLALAAANAGFPLLTDDTTYVQTEPELRVWGLPRPIHVYPEDAPEDSTGPLRLRGGKLKRAIVCHDTGVAVGAQRAALCVLMPGVGASIQPITQAEALSLLDRPEAGFDQFWGDVQAAHAALSRNGAWLLGLSSDPSEALGLLVRNLAQLQARAAL